MSDDHPDIPNNRYGGMYQQGVPFDCTKWAFIIQRYKREFQAHGKCSVGRLGMLTGISKESTRKAIDHYHNGCSIVHTRRSRGHGYFDVGFLSSMISQHHLFLYQLYMTNLAWPLVGYTTNHFQKFGVTSLRRTLFCEWYFV